MRIIKKIIAITILIGLASCKQGVSQEIKDKIKANEGFWKYRSETINKNRKGIEYPIKASITTNEERTNRIYIDNMECQFEIFVDDVLLFKAMGEITKGGGGISGSYDINQLLLTSGRHEVKVRMYPKQPLFGEEGYVNLTFSHFKDRDLRTERYNLEMNGKNGIHLDQLDKQWQDEQGEFGTDNYVDAHYKPKQPLPLKGLPYYEWRSTFEATVPFELTGWRNSVNIKKEAEDEKDIRSELLLEYKRIHEIVKKRDVAAYLQLVKEREELTTKTLYYRDSEKKQRENEFVKLLQDENYEVEPLFEETF